MPQSLHSKKYHIYFFTFFLSKILINLPKSWTGSISLIIWAVSPSSLWFYEVRIFNSPSYNWSPLKFYWGNEGSNRFKSILKIIVICSEAGIKPWQSTPGFPLLTIMTFLNHLFHYLEIASLYSHKNTMQSC